MAAEALSVHKGLEAGYCCRKIAEDINEITTGTIPYVG